jgi:hypothetical protein
MKRALPCAVEKRPHRLHLCSRLEELLAELHARGVDPVAVVRELTGPAAEIGILVTGPIPWGIADELSDLELLVLTADAIAVDEKRKILGSPLTRVPGDQDHTTEVALSISGIGARLAFTSAPAGLGNVAAPPPFARDPRASDAELLSRLATGWVVDGREIVDRWRKHYDTANLRIKWMAAEFTTAAKNLEDMEVGIGRAKGHVPTIGIYSVTHLLQALLADSGCYCNSPGTILRVSRLIDRAESPLREILIEGRGLAFPTLLAEVDEERAYFARVYEYCGKVRDLLSREQDMADVLASIIYDLDIIL